MSSDGGRDVFIALGSNLGDRWQFLRNAVSGLPDVAAISQVYETEPVGGPDNQGAYLNMVVKLHTGLAAVDLLAIAQQLEAQAGRTRVELNGPRTLDVDILLIEGETLDLPDLTVPHPRMWGRRFVLQPLGDIASHLLPEGWEDNVVGDVWVAGNL